MITSGFRKRLHVLVAASLLTLALVSVADARQETSTDIDEEVKWIESELGGKVERDDTQSGSPIIGVVFPEHLETGWVDTTRRARGQLGGRDLGRLAKIASLKSLGLDHTKVSMSDLAALSALKNLEHLGLAGVSMNSDGIRNICDITSLKSLNLNYVGELSEEDLQLIGKLPNLRHLHVRGLPISQINDDDWTLLVRMAARQVNNERLNNYRGGLTDEKLAHLLTLDLHSLDLRSSWVTAKGIEQIVESFPNLRHLNLGYVDLNDLSLEKIAELENLESLEIDFTLVTDGGTKSFEKLEKLKRLSIKGTCINDKVLETIAKLPNVESLDLTKTLIGKNSIKTLSAMPNLTELKVGKRNFLLSLCRELTATNKNFNIPQLLIDAKVVTAVDGERVLDMDLRNMRLTDDDLAVLQQFPHLQYLDLGRNQITNHGLEYVATLVDLVTLDIGYNDIDDFGLSLLTPLRKLRRLHLHETGVSLSGIRSLFVDTFERTPMEALEATGLFSEKRLERSFWHIYLKTYEVTDDDMELLAGVAAIQNLRIHGASLSDYGLQKLSEHSTLKALWLDDVRLTGKSAAVLATIPNLETLWIPDAKLDKEFVQGIVALESLQVLNLCGCNVTEDDILTLADNTGLKTLVVDGSAFSPDAASHLASLRPDLTLHRSQRETLRRVRGRKRTHKIIPQGSTAREEYAGIRSNVPENEFVRNFGDEWFEMATSMPYGTTDQHFSEIEHWKNLETLEEIHFGPIILPDGVFDHLDQLPGLRHLNLYRADLGGNHLPDLECLTRIESLEVSRSNISQEQLLAMPDMPNLKSFKLEGYRIPIEDFSFLGKMPNLESLGLSRTRLDDEAFKAVTAMTNLRELTIYETDISSLVPIADLIQLEQIDISHTQTDESDLEILRLLPHLKRVSVAKEQFSKETLDKFREARPKIRLLTR